MAMTAQGLMLSLAGVSVAPMMAFHARSKRADLIRARKVSTAFTRARAAGSKIREGRSEFSSPIATLSLSPVQGTG